MTGIPSYNVSELTYLIKNTLEDQFPVVRVQGEISTFRPAASGHCYFNLKDRDAVITAVLFRQQRQQLTFNPVDGQSVSVIGRVTVYPQRGNYQLICETMEKTGRGDILYQLELLKKRLQGEGLFDLSAKKALPPYPACIAVVTSLRGAALQDILQVLQRRMQSCRILIKDTVVQGDSSAASIIRSLNIVNKMTDVDLIILARGGGSLEDLLSFSNEEVVRAVASSRLSIITGIGHEIDFSLADFAADLRAATPSAAAEIVSQNSIEAPTRVKQMKSQLMQAMKHSFEKQRWRLSLCDRVVLQAALLDQISQRQQTIDFWRMETKRTFLNRINEFKHINRMNIEFLEASSPEKILSRGYALVSRNEKIMGRAGDLTEGDRVDLQFFDGTKSATIEGESIDI
ncbi:exodeoxyribonuclease VII large subunit [Oceanispirochaeta sp.]|jgi:exodeoxyribonuclease VII large subunit|uniref:exodeoxyribonuclease VII large subunit n=1 Tax=Oceanispirochaeta sp. TaxID=2035350 RepID=UPI0026364CB1|nr:exodeoxyribonuclease VII large subunit [Oceanispirochaeta sp.]MDA3956989.1 exodeoxyribonuclease VII large subunit [Oceanispirochaeta sp.]